MIALVLVGWARKRPPRLDAESLVAVSAETETEAQLIAAQLVSCLPDCVMPISTEILELEEL